MTRPHTPAKGHLRRMRLGPSNCDCPTRYSSTGRPHDPDCRHTIEQARWTEWLREWQGRSAARRGES